METSNRALHLRKNDEFEEDLDDGMEEEKKVGRGGHSRGNQPNDYSAQYDQSILSSPDGPLNQQAVYVSVPSLLFLLQ